jgi:hypothetical protein
MNGRFWRIVLKNSFWGDVRKFLGQLMRLTRDDVRDHIISSKIDHAPRSGADKRCISRDALRSTFARFLALSDFRVFQHNRREADIRQEIDLS